MTIEPIHYGSAAHFCASYCLWHRATKVGPYLISSVGEYWPKSERVRQRQTGKIKFEPMGAGPHLYETMVFKIIGECPCGCGLPKHDGDCIEIRRWSNAANAEAGHELFIRLYKLKAEIGEGVA